MFGKAWKLFSIRGIPVRVDTSWIVMAAMFVMGFYRQAMDAQLMGSAGALVFAFAQAGLFLGSILFHEGGHAVMCRLNGIHVRSITLFALGGYTTANLDERGPVIEFAVAVIGPLSSLALAGIFWLAAHTGLFGPAVTDTLANLAFVNLLLGLFNLLPGFPLDGGRVLRSAVWGVTKSRRKAATVARWSGQIAGVGLIAWGGWQFARGGFGGLFTVFIGFFLFQAATQSENFENLRTLLEGGVVADAMGPPPTTIPAQMTLADALEHYLRGNEGQMFPVTDAGRPIGVLTFESAAKVGQHDPLRPVRDAIVPLAQEKIVATTVPLAQAVVELQGGVTVLVVDPDGVLVGQLGAAEIQTYATRRATGQPPQAPPTAPPRPDL